MQRCNYNDRPVIAVLAQRVKDDEKKRSYIAASYVKSLESSGARVIPIPTSMPEKEVEEIFHSVNGVLFPGGRTDWETREGYYKHAIHFYTKAKEAVADNNDYFPIWATCLGLEVIYVIESRNDHNSVLSDYDNKDVSLNLEFTAKAEESRLFKDMPPDLYRALKEERLTYCNHGKGVDPKTHEREQNLASFFDVLSLNKDSQDKTFVSTVEGWLQNYFFIIRNLEKVKFQNQSY